MPPSPAGTVETMSSPHRTPHVAGVATLLASAGCTGTEIERLLVTTARHPVTGARGAWEPVYGYGIVDPDAALSAATCSGTTDPTGGDTTEDGGNGGGNGGGGKDGQKPGKGQGPEA